MRVISEKAKRALLVAFRTLMRHYYGERVTPTKGEEIINTFLEKGAAIEEIFTSRPLHFDIINSETETDNTVDSHVSDVMTHIEEGKAPYGFHVEDIENNDKKLSAYCEVAHDFFMELTGRGGTFNTDTAKENFVKAVKKCGLGYIMSEELIAFVEQQKPEVNFYNYILFLSKHGDKIEFGLERTEAESARFENIENKKKEEIAKNEAEKAAEKLLNDKHEKAAEIDADPTIYPEDETYFNEEEAFMTGPDPADYKKDILTRVLMGYDIDEIAQFAKLTPEPEDGRTNKSLSEVIADLASGRFNPDEEDFKLRNVHNMINADLVPFFIDCAQTQGLEVDEATANEMDLLHDSWDLRSPERRKLQKLHLLILKHGEQDQDLLDALRDINRLYGEKVN